jgi:AraC-like DNA-binding protein
MAVEQVRQTPSPLLRPHLLSALEAWTQIDGSRAKLREVPFPGCALIFELGSSWLVEGPETNGPERHDAFVSGLHAGPALVVPATASWSCLELRLTPVAARQILGWPMHELANRTVALDDVAPEARQLTERLREAKTWPGRFRLVESFLLRRLALSETVGREVEWSWHQLCRNAGRTPIGGLATELGWSHRRLIARFRDEVGLGPKAAARVIRFDRAVRELRSSRALGEIAYECGYADQAHLNRDFRALAGTTPAALRVATSETGVVAA